MLQIILQYWPAVKYFKQDYNLDDRRNELKPEPMWIVKVSCTNERPRMSHLVRHGHQVLYIGTDPQTWQLSCDLLTDAAGGSSFPFLANINNGEKMMMIQCNGKIHFFILFSA